MEFIKTTHIDFLRSARLFSTLSALAVAACVAILATLGMQYGVEFSGGTQLIVRFERTPEIDSIRAALDADLAAVIQTFDDPATNQVLIRIAEADVEEATEQLDMRAHRALGDLAERYAGNPVVESSTEIVGPIVGAELQRKAVQLTVVALFFQLLYIAI
ncbi:MAG TPA: hypothetical protein VGA18_00985, partial [Rhodothermales bacterium]